MTTTPNLVLEGEVNIDMPLIHNFLNDFEFLVFDMKPYVKKQQLSIFNDSDGADYIKYSKNITELPDKSMKFMLYHPEPTSEITSELYIVIGPTFHDKGNAISNTKPFLSGYYSPITPFTFTVKTYNCLSGIPNTVQLSNANMSATDPIVYDVGPFFTNNTSVYKDKCLEFL